MMRPRFCESATLASLFQPPSRANLQGEMNEKTNRDGAGKDSLESQTRNAQPVPPESALGSECAAGRLGPGRRGSSLAVLLPEARGNNSEYRQSLLRLSGRPPRSRRAALGAAVGDAGRRVGTSLPPGRVRRERPRRRQTGRCGREAVFAGGMRW